MAPKKDDSDDYKTPKKNMRKDEDEDDKEEVDEAGPSSQAPGSSGMKYIRESQKKMLQRMYCNGRKGINSKSSSATLTRVAIKMKYGMERGPKEQFDPHHLHPNTVERLRQHLKQLEQKRHDAALQIKSYQRCIAELRDEWNLPEDADDDAESEGDDDDNDAGDLVDRIQRLKIKDEEIKSLSKDQLAEEKCKRKTEPSEEKERKTAERENQKAKDEEGKVKEAEDRGKGKADDKGKGKVKADEKGKEQGKGKADDKGKGKAKDKADADRKGKDKKPPSPPPSDDDDGSDPNDDARKSQLHFCAKKSGKPFKVKVYRVTRTGGQRCTKCRTTTMVPYGHRCVQFLFDGFAHKTCWERLEPKGQGEFWFDRGDPELHRNGCTCVLCGDHVAAGSQAVWVCPMASGAHWCYDCFMSRW